MERNYSIDFFKCFAIFGVILIHSFPSKDEIGLIINVLSRFAVPFFFAAAGFFLCQRQIYAKDPINHLKRYLKKIIKIYVYWMLLYISYDILLILIYSDDIKGELLSYLEYISISRLLYYGGSLRGYHLWFLPALIFSILVVFIAYQMKKIKWLFLISFIFNLVGLMGQSYSKFINFPIETRDALFFGLFYTTLGFIMSYYKSLIKVKTLKVKSISLLLFFLFLFLQVIEYYFVNSPNGMNYYLLTIPATVSLLVFVINNTQLGKGSILTHIGANSMGIYVIHIFVLNVFNIFIYYFDLIFLSENLIWNLFYSTAILFVSYPTYNLIQQAKKTVIKVFKMKIHYKASA